MNADAAVEAGCTRPSALFRTTVEIWTEYDTTLVDLADIAREATQGDGFCASVRCDLVSDETQFPETSFFDIQA